MLYVRLGVDYGSDLAAGPQVLLAVAARLDLVTAEIGKPNST